MTSHVSPGGPSGSYYIEHPWGEHPQEGVLLGMHFYILQLQKLGPTIVHFPGWLFLPVREHLGLHNKQWARQLHFFVHVGSFFLNDAALYSEYRWIHLMAQHNLEMKWPHNRLEDHVCAVYNYYQVILQTNDVTLQL